MKKPALLVVFSLAAISGLLAGCAPVVVGGAATGANIVHDRRTTGTFIEDQSIEFKAYEALGKAGDLKKQSHINVTSYNLIVLLTGETPTEEYRSRAEQIVSSLPRVRRVYNELSVAAPSSLMSRSSDTVITTKVKTSLLGIDIKGFDPTRVKVVTERGNVYLMGLVTHSEGDAAAEKTRHVGGVQRVVKLFEYLD